MKHIIKNFLYLELGTIMIAIIIGIAVFPLIYIDNVLFAILYLVIIYPLIMLGVYKIAVILNAKTGKL